MKRTKAAGLVAGIGLAVASIGGVLPSAGAAGKVIKKANAGKLVRSALRGKTKTNAGNFCGVGVDSAPPGAASTSPKIIKGSTVKHGR